MTFGAAACCVGQILPGALLYPEEEVEKLHEVLSGTSFPIARDVGECDV